MKENRSCKAKVCVAALAAALAALQSPAAAPAGFEAQGRKRLLTAYRSFNKETERTAQFAAMGIATRCIFIANTVNGGGNPYCEYPPVWTGPKRYDWSRLDAQFFDILAASPNARFMAMIDLNTPYWAVRRLRVDSHADITHASCNAKWRSLAREWLVDCIAYAEKRWGAHIDCYILSGGATSEWYELASGSWRTSENKDRAWTKWCKRRGLSFGETVPVQPTLARAAFENLVYDPASEPEKIAYWKFHNSLPADALLHFASAARKAIPKEKELGAFFGYSLLGAPYWSSFGHLDCSRVFASPDIDFFIAPGNYSERAIGGGSGSQLPPGSVMLRGKRFLHEVDFGPHDQKRWGGGVWKTLADDLAGNTREAAFAMAENASLWWFDMWGGFYRDPKVRERIAALKKIRDGLKPAPSVAEILLVCDPESMCHINEKSPLARTFGDALRNNLSRTGAPYDAYSFDDLAEIDLDRYKLVCLPQTVLITPERAKLLREKVCANGRTVLWSIAPGVTDGKTLDAGRVKDWAGVAFKAPGLNVTRLDGWTGVYAFDRTLLTPETLSRIAASAGVHLYADAPAAVFANENFLAVHTKDGGEKTIRLPRHATRVVDLLSGETMAENADRFTVRFAAPDTRLFAVSHRSGGG